MKFLCWFLGHEWIYSEIERAQSASFEANVPRKRVCKRCGIEHRSFGATFEYTNGNKYFDSIDYNWVRVK